MELALSLGDSSKPFPFLENPPMVSERNLGFIMAFSGGRNSESPEKKEAVSPEGDGNEKRDSSDPPIQLDLLPFSPVPRPQPSNQLRFSWLTDNHGSDPGSGGLDMDWTLAAEETEEGAALSSPNSAASSFPMDFGIGSGFKRRKRDMEAENEQAGSQPGSDDDENGSTRKKLRLSKEQSAFLEESFKEHNTLNPKEKLALAKQLNLRPRQIEVWFQNRRARTKLKQTEVDCEYLKRCCETLTEENRRLQKELKDLRALKTSQPFYMQLPATTLTMCPSCERVATATTTTVTANTAATAGDSAKLFPFSALKQEHGTHAQAKQGAAS